MASTMMKDPSMGLERNQKASKQGFANSKATQSKAGSSILKNKSVYVVNPFSGRAEDVGSPGKSPPKAKSSDRWKSRGGVKKKVENIQVVRGMSDRWYGQDDNDEDACDEEGSYVGYREWEEEGGDKGYGWLDGPEGEESTLSSTGEDWRKEFGSFRTFKEPEELERTSSSQERSDLAREEEKQAEEAREAFEEMMRKEPGKCTCQWEWDWNDMCPLHGARVMRQARDADSGDVDERAAITNERNRRRDLSKFGITTNNAMMGSAHQYSIQSHAGVGIATAGVRKDEKGWWVDKGDFHNREVKVKFGVVEDEEERQRRKKAEMEAKFTPTTRIITGEGKLNDSLNRARERLEESNSNIKELKGEVMDATRVLKEVRVERLSGERDTMDLKRGKVLEAAQSIQEDRLGFRRQDVVVDSTVENNASKRDVMSSRQHLPKHVRASYERDIDKVQHGFRVRNNVIRERAASGYR